MAEARTTIFELLPAIAQLPGRCQGESILLMKLDQLEMNILMKEIRCIVQFYLLYQLYTPCDMNVQDETSDVTSSNPEDESKNFANNAGPVDKLSRPMHSMGTRSESRKAIGLIFCLARWASVIWKHAAFDGTSAGGCVQSCLQLG